MCPVSTFWSYLKFAPQCDQHLTTKLHSKCAHWKHLGLHSKFIPPCDQYVTGVLPRFRGMLSLTAFVDSFDVCSTHFRDLFEACFDVVMSAHNFYSFKISTFDKPRFPRSLIFTSESPYPRSLLDFYPLMTFTSRRTQTRRQEPIEDIPELPTGDNNKLVLQYDARNI